MNDKISIPRNVLKDLITCISVLTEVISTKGITDADKVRIRYAERLVDDATKMINFTS